jgi:hypothetical protein
MQDMKWTVIAMIFSGRPDPQWDLPEELVVRWQELWAQLPESIMPATQSFRSGYKGCRIRHGADWLLVNKGIITLHSGGLVLSRLDEGNKLELMLLRSAPLEWQALIREAAKGAFAEDI